MRGAKKGHFKKRKGHLQGKATQRGGTTSCAHYEVSAPPFNKSLLGFEQHPPLYWSARPALWFKCHMQINMGAL
eukprot:1159918-Pelagomonas_calceolata.AAC.3